MNNRLDILVIEQEIEQLKNDILLYGKSMSESQIQYLKATIKADEKAIKNLKKQNINKGD